MTAVCKTVGFGYPGSNPGPATTSENSLLISPCSGEELVLGCPMASGGNRPAMVGPGEYVAKSHTMAVVWPPSPRKAWCIGFRLIGARSGRSSGARPCCAETCPYRLRRGPVDEHAGRRVGLARGASQPSASEHRGRPSRLQRSGRFARPGRRGAGGSPRRSHGGRDELRRTRGMRLRERVSFSPGTEDFQPMRVADRGQSKIKAGRLPGACPVSGIADKLPAGSWRRSAT